MFLDGKGPSFAQGGWKTRKKQALNDERSLRVSSAYKKGKGK